jgi:predicted MFS family arabinose efflux permease
VPAGFGLLSAEFGAGANFGALIIPHYLQQLALNAIVKSGVMLWTVAVVLIAVTHFTLLALLGAFACGMAWVAVFVSLSAGTQSAAPAWVRARAVGMNMVSAQASLALGSALWGAVASGVGTQIALGISAFAQITLYYLYRRVRVEMGSEKDVTPSLHLPELPSS